MQVADLSPLPTPHLIECRVGDGTKQIRTLMFDLAVSGPNEVGKGDRHHVGRVIRADEQRGVPQQLCRMSIPLFGLPQLPGRVHSGHHTSFDVTEPLGHGQPIQKVEKNF